MTVHGLFGLLVYNLCYKLYVGVYEAENGYEIRVQKWNRCWVIGREQ